MKGHVLTLAILIGLGLLLVGGLSDGVDVTGDASAYCNQTYQALTGDCNPCYTTGSVLAEPYEKVTGQPWICLT